MKNLWSLIGAAGMLIAPNLYAGFDGTITLTAETGLQYGDGGIFHAATALNASPQNAGTPNLGNFGTFCLEYTEEFNFNGTYDYQINSGAVLGGGASKGANTTNPRADAPSSGLNQSMDNISIGTAWLYSQYRAGHLNITSASQAGALQLAIWYLEGEITQAQMLGGANHLTYFDSSVSGSAFYDAAKAGTSKNDTTVFGDSNGAYGVVALNLYTTDASHGLVQDQLGIVPEPSTMLAGGLLLLPFAARTIRRLRKARVA